MVQGKAQQLSSEKYNGTREGVASIKNTDVRKVLTTKKIDAQKNRMLEKSEINQK